jgi:Concanavalin A-like lectin/glucanases superfamily
MALVFLGIAGTLASAPVPEALRSALTLHASFEKGFEADFARGDKRLFHAPNYKQVDALKAGVGAVDVLMESGSGIAGSTALRFRTKNTHALFYRGEGHVAPVSGTISFWLRLDPQKDLAPGFSDPIQITDKDYNDSAIWVDFSKDEVPRHFRLGMFGERKVWNPADLPPDKNPDFTRRLVVVERPPFAHETWTHVGITWSELGSGKGTGALYLNGKLVSNNSGIRESFVWDPSKVAIRLGVNYVGWMDEIAVFNRDLNSSEVEMMFDAGRAK